MVDQEEKIFQIKATLCMCKRQRGVTQNDVFGDPLAVQFC